MIGVIAALSNITTVGNRSLVEMVRLTKCCVIFPLRPGCVAIGVIFGVLSLMGAINKLIEITLFTKTLNSEENLIQDTRRENMIQAKIVRFIFVMLVEVLICCSAGAFTYGVLMDRLRVLPPFIIHLKLKVGYYLVHYFDVGTKHIEAGDTTGMLRLYIFGLIISAVFTYLWLCCYSAFLELKAQKDMRVISAGIENPRAVP